MENQPQNTEFRNNPIELGLPYEFGQCSKTCVKWSHSKRLKIGFQDQLSLNAGQKYCKRGAFCNTFDLH